MKTFISFLIAAILIGLVLFAIFYWLIKMDFRDAVSASMAGAVAGFVVDYVREIRKKKIAKH